jgi:mevalonate pyrophosphate decarboxylase
LGLQLHRQQSSSAQGRQQQQQIPKLCMKQGKHLAQAAALKAQASGAAAACLALKRRRPLQISPAAVRAASGVW